MGYNGLMKDFFAAIVDIVVGALLKARDGLKSFQIKTLGADIAYGVKSLFSSSDDYGESGSRKKIIIVGSAAVILVAIACVKLFWPSGPVSERVKLVAAETEDANGDVWGLQLLKGQSSQIIARAGVKPGPPLLVKGEVAMRGRTVEVGVTMQGQAGEKYVPGVQKNGNWLPAPRFGLVSENGKVLAAGRFEYG